MEKYLKTFLDQLPQQTFFKHLEIIINHNEPTTEELEWVKAFQNLHPGHLKHIVTPRVVPLGTSWNTCIKNASGKFLTIWNVDDLRTPQSIELQAQILIQNKNIDVAYGDYNVVDTFGKTDGIYVQHYNIPEAEFTRSMVYGPFMMFRKSILEKVGCFDEQLKSALDFDFAIRASIHSNAKKVTGLLGYYLNDGTGLSTRPNSLNDIERTVIELRYGIYDKIDYNFLPQATMYNIPYLRQYTQWNHIQNFVPEYKNFLEHRKQKWFLSGIKKFVRNKNKQLLRTFLKKFSHGKHNENNSTDASKK
jgi:glycosyltransferase involved in cell wall biosynthesis